MNFNEEGLRNYKDFLSTYNKISEACFNSCVVNLNARGLSDEEASCAENCAERQINYQNKAVTVWAVEQPRLMEKKMQEAQEEADRTIERLKQEGVDTDGLTAQEVAAAAVAHRSQES